MLDTHELSRRPGTMRTHSAVVEAPSAVGTPVIAVPEGAGLELDLRLEAVMEGVLISGAIRGRAIGECARCLDEVRIDVEAPLQELYAYPERAEAEAAAGDVEVEDEESVLEGDLADIEPALRDSVVTALPFQPLCRPDCPGLCSECGAHLADDPSHHHDLVDPRWSALQSMLDSTSMSDETKES